MTEISGADSILSSEDVWADDSEEAPEDSGQPGLLFSPAFGGRSSGAKIILSKNSAVVSKIMREIQSPANQIRPGTDHSRELFLPKNINTLLNDIIKSLKKMSVTDQRFIYCEFRGQLFRVKICFYNIHIPTPSVDNRHIIHQSEMEFRALHLMLPLLNEGYLDTIVRLYHVHTMDNMKAIMPSAAECTKSIQKKNLINTLCKYAHLVENGLALNKCSFLIMEECDVPLSVFLVKYIDSPLNFEIIRMVLFEIVHALYVISRRYPKMHHYDLHTDNIIMKFDRRRLPGARAQYREFNVVRGKKAEAYFVPYFYMTPKIIDFEYAVIPEEGIMSEATIDRLVTYQRPENDFVLTLYWVYRALQQHGLLTAGLEEMFKEIEPNESYKKYEIYHLRKIEPLIPGYGAMLRCGAFKQYRRRPDDGEIIASFKAI